MPDIQTLENEGQAISISELNQSGGQRRGGFIERQLILQGFDFTISDEFTRIPLTQGELKKDELMQVPVEDDAVRAALAQEFTAAVANGESWMTIYSDADQLKRANDKSRALGDMAIVYTASIVSRTVEDLNLPSGVRVFLVRNRDAADETICWVFGASPDDIIRLEDKFSSIKPAPAKIRFSDNSEKSPVSFDFSATVSSVSYHDPELFDELQATREFLRQNPDKIAWNLYNKVGTKAGERAKSQKAEKEKRQIEQTRREELEVGLPIKLPAQLIDEIAEKYGGGRLTKNSLKMLLKWVAFETIQPFSQNPDLYREMCYTLGIDEDELKNAKQVKDLVSLFDSLSPSRGET